MGVAETGALLGTIITVLGFVAVGVYARPFLKGRQIIGTLAEKDEVIKTNEQTIKAFEGRMGTLQAQIDGLVRAATTAEQKILQLQAQLDQSLDRYRELERYTAPQAVRRFQDALDEQSILRTQEFLEISKALKRIAALLEKGTA